MSESKTITKDEGLLDNVHPGEILREDFLIDKDIPVEQVAIAAGVSATKLRQVLDGKSAIDADMDIRLARYFGMSEGFFLRLQNCFDLEEVRRQNGAELDLIIRRAA